MDGIVEDLITEFSMIKEIEILSRVKLINGSHALTIEKKNIL